MTKLTKRTLAFYSLPALPVAALLTPVYIYGPPFYAADMGLGLTAVGAIFMLARFWDVLTDPVMGILSDKFPSRWGLRRHWMVLSIPLLMGGAVLVMFPNWFEGSKGNNVYLVASLFLLYIGFTMLTISHTAWGAELTDDYNERSRVQGWREFAQISSMLLVLLIPAIFEQSGNPLSNTLKINAMGTYVLLLIPVTILLSVFMVGERPIRPRKPIGFVYGVRVLFSNRYMLRIILADFFISIPNALRGALYIFYVTAVIGRPEWSAVLLLMLFLAGPLAVPLWIRISYRVSKHKACAVAVLLHLVVTLSYLIPGEGDVVLFATLLFLTGVVHAGIPFLLRSMIADVVDYDRLETGQDRAGIYYALVSTTTKVGGAVAIGIAYPLLDFVGFDPNLTDPGHAQGLKYVFAIIPSIAELLIVSLLFRYPLDEHMLRHIQTRLAAR